jgi:hypothetical protein
MDENPCNCKTCAYFRPYVTGDMPPKHHCSSPLINTNDCFTPFIGADEYWRICVLGCVGHSKVREYIMEDAIENLGMLIEQTENPIRIKAFHDAIRVIKNGR